MEKEEELINKVLDARALAYTARHKAIGFLPGTLPRQEAVIAEMALNKAVRELERYRKGDNK